MTELRFSAGSAATLLASPERGYRFAGWTSGGLACAAGARANPCVLPPGQAISDAAARAFFEAVPSAPGVSASPGGSVRLVAAGPSEGAPASSSWTASPNGFLTELRFSAGSAATLLAFPERGHRFAGWTLSGGLACDSGASGEDGNPCVLPAGPAIAGAAARAFFEAVPATLTVSAGVGGSVTAEVAGAGAVAVAADSSQGLAFGDASSATLTAVPAAGYAFAGWALSGGAACASGARANPCELPPGSATAAAAVGAAFSAVANTLTVAAGSGGSVDVVVAGASEAAVRPGGSMAFPFSVESSATLSAMPAAGYAFAGWTLSPPGLACESGTQANICALAAGSATADAVVDAAFVAVATTLTVSAGTGGSVAAEVAGASEPAVRPGGSMAFPYSVLSVATLTATADSGYAFAGWALSGQPGLACESGTQANICALATGSATADAAVEAAFRAVATTLTVSAGTGGSVAAEVAGADTVAVAADSSRSLAFSVLSAATLMATAGPGYAFAGWTLSGGAACASGTRANPCALPAGSVTVGAAVEAAFEPVERVLTLTVAASPGGSVAAEVAGASMVTAVTVGAGFMQDFAVSIDATTTLTAVPATGYRFASWTPSGGLECESGMRANPCELPAGSVTVDATVGAAFEAVATTLTVTAGVGGSVIAEIDGAFVATVGAGTYAGFLPFGAGVATRMVLTAVPATGYRFAGWTLSGGLACESGTRANPCALATGSATGGTMVVEAAFAVVATTLTVSAGTGGSVAAEVAGADTVAVAAGSSQSIAFSVLSAATLTATADSGYVFAGWALSGQPGLACAGRNDANPCALPPGSVTADAAVEAAFRAVTSTLTIISFGNGSVVIEVDGVGSVELDAGTYYAEFSFSVETVTLTAVAAAGYGFSGWTLSPPGLACESGTQANVCALAVGSITAGAVAEAAFEAIANTLTIAAGAGGSVAAEIVGASTVMAVTVNAGSSQDLAVSVGAATVRLTAVPAAGYAFAGWTLSDGLACAGGTDANPCALPAGSVIAGAAVEAAFEAIANTLTVGAGTGGSVVAEIAGASTVTAVTVNAGSSQDLTVSVGAATVRLTAVPTAGYAFAGWTLSDGLACESGTQANPCELGGRPVTADTTVEAAFAAVVDNRNLAVSAGPGGSVVVSTGPGHPEVTVAAGSSQTFSFTSPAGGPVNLRAVPGTLWRFSDWTLSDALECLPGTRPDVCELPATALAPGGDSSVDAVFEATTLTLTLGTSSGGRFNFSTSRTGWQNFFPRGFYVADTATVTVTAADNLLLRDIRRVGYHLAGWMWSDGLDCAVRRVIYLGCTLRADAIAGGAPLQVSAAFEPTERILTVVSGPGGSVVVTPVSGSEVTVAADSQFAFVANVDAAPVLEAKPDPGWRFAGWALSGRGAFGRGPVCRSGTGDLVCQPRHYSSSSSPYLNSGLSADVTATAAFEAVTTTLTVASGDGGCLFVFGDSLEVVFPGTSIEFPVNVGRAVQVRAVPYAGHRFAGWTLSDGLACARWTRADVCVLRAGSVTAGAAIEAAFRTVATTLTVTAGAGGLVAAEVAGASAVTVGAGSGQDFTVSVEATTARLTAVPAAGHNFAGWTLSPPELACAGGKYARVCALAVGSAAADATVEATFEEGPFAAWRGPGSVSVPSDGSTRIAVPYAPGAFEGWDGAPCDGSKQPECDVSSVTAGERLPTAAFRPFVAGGIKSLAFGLGYHGEAPDHFMVSFRDAPGAGFTPVPGLGEVAPGSGPARLLVSVHLLPWGRGAYLTEACDASLRCVAANGGEGVLKQPDSVAATGYFKAPNATGYDFFGGSVALSADGGTLAVGAWQEGSVSTGTFAPGDEGYQAALDSEGLFSSGAVYVYRRSTAGHWALEAFVKAPRVGALDGFGSPLALSGDGATLAVGTGAGDSAATGTFAPGDEGYQAALDSDGATNSGAVTVYRRSGSTWHVEAFVKAPKAGVRDFFGSTLALSGDGATLVVGAPSDDSASAGVFAPGDAGYQAALDSNGVIFSGAVTVYRRSGSTWHVEAFVKAPKAGVRDFFGHALALSGDGATLAVGAPWEGSARAGAFAPSDPGYRAALDDNGAVTSGAAYVYRRSGSAWRVEAFVKAPVAGAGDHFGSTLALSGDGATLAVGAPLDDSAATGTFDPGGAGYQAALGDNSAYHRAGAATVYRRSGSTWHVEAFVKAPRVDGRDRFGSAIALSADGAMLAVGARYEDSASAGVFAPGDAGYQAALDGEGSFDSGAVTVYRRSGSAWRVEAFVKASNAGAGDHFGQDLALSADGGTLAVGASGEDGGAQPQPLSGFHEEVPVDVEPSSGAVYLY